MPLLPMHTELWKLHTKKTKFTQALYLIKNLRYFLYLFMHDFNL